MAPQFKNMNELTEYLTSLEQQIKTLQEENLELSKRISTTRPPKSNIFSNKFFPRAFAIWGHFMTANIIISSIGIILYFCIIVTVINALTGSTTNPSPTPTLWLPVQISPP
ncbi:MAG: hypothetical protein HZB19_15245 [Chloroflexi bacterium]|nr:hypothetical protein [Chloroflexota bacterium]